jgi:hypothetical protein
LAVGNNGESLVADSSTSTGLRYNPQNDLANPIINGGMDIWQRGTSISLSASSGNVYTADRWQTGTGANQACTISRQATGDTTNLPNIQYAQRYQRNSGQTGTGGLNITSSLETTNSIPFAGKTVTMSFYARKGANYAPSTFNVYLITGTGTDQNRQNGSYTGENSSISSAITLTTTWQRFVVTGTIPTNATEMAVSFFFDFTGTAGAADYFDITGFQIDLGTYTASTAPAFRRSGGTIQGELAACQRYYWRITGQTSGNYFTAGYANSTVSAIGIVSYPVIMRVAPSATFSAAGDFNFTWSAGVSTISAAAIDLATTNAIFLRLTTTGLTSNGGGGLSLSAGTTKYLEASAEL